MISHYKIIHTSCNIQWESIEKRIFNESVWMEQNEHQIIIIAPKESPLYLKAKQHGFKVYGIEFKFFSRIKDYKLLKAIFYNEKPDIVNTHGDKDSQIALHAAKNSSVPLRILSRHINTLVRNSWYNRLVYKKFCHYIFTGDDSITMHLQKVFRLNRMKIFSMPDGLIMPDHEKTELFINEKELDDTGDNILSEQQYTINTMGRNIIRIYSLHQIKLNQGKNPEYY